MVRTLKAPNAARVRAPGAAAPRLATTRPSATLPELAAIRPLGEALSDALLYCDPEGRVRYVNREACRLLDCTAAWPLGRPAAEVLRTAVPAEDLFAEARAGHALGRETLLVTRAGSEVPARVSLAPLPDGGAWAVLRDLTQAQRLQRELRMRERLATVGELAAGVAHEIRNPLAGISSSAQVLLTRFEPRDDRQKFCRVIIDQVDRLDHIITSLLKFARPPEPRLKLARLEEVVQRILRLEAERLADLKITTQTRFATRMPALYIDPGLIEQVLLNLVVNAEQAMAAGGTLTIELGVATKRDRPAPRSVGRREADAREHAERAAQAPAAPGAPGAMPPATPARRVARLRLIDTGVGIPREVVPRLFDPFFTTKAGGTGLGLSISQSILQEHGGVISIASREGRGTTVVVELPLEKRNGPRRQDAR
jgi:two-component system sensor histidine kinase HydH